MVRRPIPESREQILVRKVNFLPDNIDRQENDPIKITLDTDLGLVLSYPTGFFNNTSRACRSSAFAELRVAQAGSGLDNLQEQSGNTPSSYDATNLIQRDNGFLRVDVLVQTNSATIRFTKLDGNTTGDIILDPGRYSFDFNCTQVEIKDNGTAGGTHQLVGYFSEEFDINS